MAAGGARGRRGQLINQSVSKDKVPFLHTGFSSNHVTSTNLIGKEVPAYLGYSSSDGKLAQLRNEANFDFSTLHTPDSNEFAPSRSRAANLTQHGQGTVG